MSGPPSPRATALHHYRPQSLNDDLQSQLDGKPLHPCQRVNNNLVELKLSNHFNKVQITAPFSGNTIELTESGLRHMNRLKLPPSSRRRVVKSKLKPKKFSTPTGPVKRNSFAGHWQDKDVMFNRAVVEDGSMDMMDDMDSIKHKSPLAPSRVSRSRQSNVGRPGVGGFVLHGRGSGGRRYAGRGARANMKKKGPAFAPTAQGPSNLNHLGNQLSQVIITLFETKCNYES